MNINEIERISKEKGFELNDTQSMDGDMLSHICYPHVLMVTSHSPIDHSYIYEYALFDSNGIVVAVGNESGREGGFTWNRGSVSFLKPCTDSNIPESSLSILWEK